jgi:hypothetical protein
MSGPSAHLSWGELSCYNRLTANGKPVPFRGIPHGGLVAPYPLDLRETRGQRLGFVFEAIRSGVSHRLGRETPLVVTSAYRTPEYDKAVGGKSNWHVKAGAIDIDCPSGLTVVEFHAVIVSLAKNEIADIGGIGIYDWGCHVDIRPRLRDMRVARWDYRTKERP